MKFGEVDHNAIHKVLDALSSGMRRVESGTAGGRKITGYYITDNQVRIDITEGKMEEKNAKSG